MASGQDKAESELYAISWNGLVNLTISLLVIINAGSVTTDTLNAAVFSSLVISAPE